MRSEGAALRRKDSAPSNFPSDSAQPAKRSARIRWKSPIPAVRRTARAAQGAATAGIAPALRIRELRGKKGQSSEQRQPCSVIFSPGSPGTARAVEAATLSLSPDRGGSAAFGCHGAKLCTGSCSEVSEQTQRSSEGTSGCGATALCLLFIPILGANTSAGTAPPPSNPSALPPSSPMVSPLLGAAGAPGWERSGLKSYESTKCCSRTGLHPETHPHSCTAQPLAPRCCDPEPSMCCQQRPPLLTLTVRASPCPAILTGRRSRKSLFSSPPFPPLSPGAISPSSCFPMETLPPSSVSAISELISLLLCCTTSHHCRAQRGQG